MKESKESLYRRVWREDRKGGNDIIILSQKMFFLKRSKAS